LNLPISLVRLRHGGDQLAMLIDDPAEAHRRGLHSIEAAHVDGDTANTYVIATRN